MMPDVAVVEEKPQLTFGVIARETLVEGVINIQVAMVLMRQEMRKATEILMRSRMKRTQRHPVRCHERTKGAEVVIGVRLREADDESIERAASECDPYVDSLWRATVGS